MKKSLLLTMSLIIMTSLVACSNETNSLKETESIKTENVSEVLSETTELIRDSVVDATESTEDTLKDLSQNTESEATKPSDSVKDSQEETSESNKPNPSVTTDSTNPEEPTTPTPPSNPSEPKGEADNEEINDYKETNYDLNISKSLNNFTKNLSTNLSNKEKNLIFSPCSIYTALLTSTNGSYVSNNARIEILNVLGIQDDTSYSNLGTSFKKLNDILTKSKIFTNATSVWLDNSVVDNDNLHIFRDNIETYMNANSYKKELTSPSVINEANKWVNDKTNGLIKDAGLKTTKDSKLVLLNAVYFKDSWLSPFQDRFTKEAPFYGTTKESIVDMMNKYEIKNDYYSNNKVQAISLKYKGGDYAMEVYIPHDKTQYIGDLITDIDLNNVGFSQELLNISVPKFEQDFDSSDMVSVLKKLGIKDAFDSSKDNFEMIAPNLYISDVVHKAKIKVNEQGTEAAATTSMLMALGSAPGDKPIPIDFIADCPFVYIIRHVDSNAIVFYGINNNLEK